VRRGWGSRAVLASRSTNGGLTWQNPVTVAQTATNFFDKNWMVCDNYASSPFYGTCYAEWDDNSLGNRLLMSRSTDGGLTWGPPLAPAGLPSGLGGQPVALPNGTLVVPYTANYGSIRAFRSTDGGASWSSSVLVATQSTHSVAGGMRDPPLPSAEVDGTGRVYVAWHDCRFRSGCTSNDIVYSTSTDGVSWTQVARVPIDPVTSTFDHFLPGFGADRNSRRVAVTYYYYRQANCSVSTCQLSRVHLVLERGRDVEQSEAARRVDERDWIPNTSQGRMGRGLHLDVLRRQRGACRVHGRRSSERRDIRPRDVVGGDPRDRVRNRADSHPTARSGEEPAAGPTTRASGRWHQARRALVDKSAEHVRRVPGPWPGT
jgi:hypothetical protein